MSNQPTELSFNTPDFSALRVSVSGDEGTDHPRRSTRSGVSTLSGESTVFDTAVSTASPGTGGGATSDASYSGKLYQVKHVVDSSSLCGCIIPSSDGNRVCAKLRKECTAVSHVERVKLEDDCLYVSPRKDVILRGLSLSKQWLSEPEFKRTLLKKQTIGVWSVYFDQIKDSAAWEQVDTPTSQITIEDAARAEEDLKTPKKVRLSSLIADFKDDDTTVEDLLRKPKFLHRLATLAEEDGTIPTDLEDIVKKLAANWDKIQVNFDDLEMQESINRTSIDSLQRATESLIKTTEDKFNLIDTKAKIILNLIGDDEAASANGERSIWKAISLLQKECIDMKEDFDSKITDLDVRYVARCLNLEKVAGVDREGIQRNADFLLQFKKVFEGEMTKIFDMLQNLLEKGTHTTGGLGAGQPVGGKSGYFHQLEPVLMEIIRFDPIRRIKDIGERLTLVENKFDSQTSADDAGIKRRTVDWAGGFGNMNSISEDNIKGFRERGNFQPTPTDGDEGMRRELELLKKHVLELQKRIKGESYSSREFHINSFAEAVDFVDRTNLDIAWIWDIFSVLVSMGSKRLDAKQLSDWRHSASKTRTTKRASQLEASMSSGRPSVFFGETSDGRARPLKEGMANCTSWEQWSGTHEPFKETCTTELINFIDGIQGDLPELIDFSDGSENSKNTRDGVNLAITLLVDIQNQWTALTGFIQTAYNDLTVRGKFTSKTAWLLVGRYVAAIFTAMITVRNPARGLDDPTTLKSRATLFWSVLQCHRIMKEFIDEKFMGHPLIVKETSFFTLTDRVSEEDLADHKEKMKKELEAQKLKIAALEADKRSRDDTIKDLHQKYSTLLNQVNQMGTKLDKLAKK